MTSETCGFACYADYQKQLPTETVQPKLFFNYLKSTSSTVTTIDDNCPSTPDSPPIQCFSDSDSGFSSSDENSSSSPTTVTSSICCERERSKTLPSALKSPTNKKINSKKAVRFADSIGLDLEHIQSFTTLNDDYYQPPMHQHPIITNTYLIPIPKQQPKAKCRLTCTNFPSDRKDDTESIVNLRSLSAIDMNITGIVSVANIAFQKDVAVRYSLDDWYTWSETRAIYDSTIDSNRDTFSFFISFPSNLPIGTRCQLCIRYRIGIDIEHWDNNNGHNYLIECVTTVGDVVKKSTTIDDDMKCRRRITAERADRMLRDLYTPDDEYAARFY